MTQHIALIRGGIVENVIVGDPDFVPVPDYDAVVVEDGTHRPGIGWRYDGQQFAQPFPANLGGLGSWITQEAYRLRFTFDERRAIAALAETDLDVRVAVDDLAAAVHGVDLDAPATQQDCAMLTQKTYNGAPVLTPARVGEIIGAPVQFGEVPPK